MDKEKLKKLVADLEAILPRLNEAIAGMGNTEVGEPVHANGYRRDDNLTIEDVQAVGMKMVAARRGEWLKKLLDEVFDAGRISQLPRENWEEFIDTVETELREAGK